MNNQPMLINYDEFESPFLGQLIGGDEFGEAWDSLLRELLNAGRQVTVRDKPTRECLGMSFSVTNMASNILINPGRDLNYRFMVAEWEWIREARSDLAPLLKYNKRMVEFSDNGVWLEGAYGPRLIPQLYWVKDALKKDPLTRQAVATIWSPRPEPSKDIPCTISLQWLIRRKLHCIVTMRSSDVWLGLPYDFFTFSMLTMELAESLNVQPGSLLMNLGSSHLYESNFDKANLAAFADSTTLTMPIPFTAHRKVFDTILDTDKTKNKAEALKLLRELCANP